VNQPYNNNFGHDAITPTSDQEQTALAATSVARRRNEDEDEDDQNEVDEIDEENDKTFSKNRGGEEGINYDDEHNNNNEDENDDDEDETKQFGLASAELAQEHLNRLQGLLDHVNSVVIKSAQMSSRSVSCINK
jgi:hypothetical protein